MEIDITKRDSYAIIQPREDILLHNSCDFKDCISTILENDFVDIIIDLSNISFANSAFIASLIFAAKKAQEKERECYVSNVAHNVLRTIRVSQLESFFKIAKDNQEAILNSSKQLTMQSFAP